MLTKVSLPPFFFFFLSVLFCSFVFFNFFFLLIRTSCFYLLKLVLKSSVNTKVDMRFNVKNADWLGERIREKIMQMVCYYQWSMPLGFVFPLLAWIFFLNLFWAHYSQTLDIILVMSRKKTE